MTLPRFWTDILTGTNYTAGQRLKSTEQNQYLSALRRFDLAFERLSTSFATLRIVATGTSPASAALYDSYYRLLYVFCKDVATGLPDVFRYVPGSDTAGEQIQVSAAVQHLPRCVASNGAGTIVTGGTPPSSSNAKYFYTTSGGGTSAWTGAVSSQTSTAGALSMVWDPVGAVFVSGLSDGKIETSPNGITWTNQTIPNSNARAAMATNGTGTIVAVTSASTDKCVYSTDAGVTWAEATMPATGARYGVCWAAGLGKFFAIRAGHIESSPDGIVWSAVAATGGSWGIASSGNFLILAGASPKISENGGTTWRPLADPNSAFGTYGGIGWNAGVLYMFADNTADGYICASLPAWY
jgi:hypothetical protein